MLSVSEELQAAGSWDLNKASVFMRTTVTFQHNVALYKKATRHTCGCLFVFDTMHYLGHQGGVYITPFSTEMGKEMNVFWLFIDTIIRFYRSDYRFI